ncbi:hypothetical protein [Bacillus sp. SM2101]|uniref:hypothetical protein n=1 Tax=Bacillus sp. SM2101 TaxID=2805366 RepID=UPI001BDEF1A8|nr:hypothetical protein [Bacillus sp. SM2101]
MKFLSLAVAGGLLTTGLGASGVYLTEDENLTTEEKLLQYGTEFEGGTQIAIKDIPQDLWNEIEATNSIDEHNYQLLEVYEDDKTGLHFVQDPETKEYLHKLKTLKTDINTGEIFDAETDELLTKPSEIVERLWVEVEGGMQMSKDDVPEKLMNLLNDELGPIEEEYKLIQVDPETGEPIEEK